MFFVRELCMCVAAGMIDKCVGTFLKLGYMRCACPVDLVKKRGASPRRCSPLGENRETGTDVHVLGNERDK